MAKETENILIPKLHNSKVSLGFKDWQVLITLMTLYVFELIL